MSRTFRTIRLLPASDSIDRQRYNFGEIFYDRDNQTIRVMDGEKQGGYQLLRADLSNIEGALGATVSSTAPSNPSEGNIWLDEDTGKLYVYVSSAWIEPSTSGGGGGGGISDLAGFTTSDLAEGTNQYFTSARARSALSSASDGTISSLISYNSATGVIRYRASTSYITEGTNLYYTDARVTTRINNTSINALSDVDTTTVAPGTGQVLKWNGTNWAPADDIASGGSGLDADTLDGFDSSYYLNYNNLSNKPTIPTNNNQLTNGAGYITSASLTWTNVTGKPTFATVATSGAYTDLSGTPTLATVATSGAYTDLSGTPTLATVATSGSYDDLSSRPTIPSAIFSTIAVSGQANVVADSATDTLTLAAGSNITITTNSGTDTITISADVTGISDIVSDTSPQLGGNLDVNGNSIVSTSNGNISITPDGFGVVVLDGLSWPTADGSNQQVLTTDGLGNLTFESIGTITNLFDQSLNTDDDVSFNTVTTNGTGTPTFNSSGDFAFNTGSSLGALIVDGSIEATKIMTLTPQSSAPTAVVGSFAVADRTNWDPAGKGTGNAYPVFYDGSTWTALY